MDLPREKKPIECEDDCECKDCEMRDANDDARIQVSVSPRRFGLPPAQEKKAKMEIKNKNPYPIYFKANTSNMDAFKTQPNCGRIAPNSKASVDVQFNDSAMPLRRHEEVIVFTSVKPFEEYALYQERICPYCMEPFDFSKHHSRKTHTHNLKSHDHHSHKKSDKLPKYTTKYYAESAHEDYDKKYKDPTKQKQKVESDKKQAEPKRVIPSETKGIKETQDERKMKTTDYVQKHFSSREPRIANSDEKVQKRREHVSTTYRKRCHGLKEMCIHAMVHEHSSGDCECGSCLKLSIAEKDGRKFEIDSASDDVRKIKSDEHVSERRLRIIEKDKHKGGDTRDLKDKKGKVKEAHIRARILRADYAKETSSDTEISVLSSKDLKIPTRQTKIISEEDYKRKKEKMKRKYPKLFEDESESTSTTDSKGQKKEVDEKITKLERKSFLKDIDEKCDNLLRMSWGNLLLLLLLIFIVIGGLFCCCRPLKGDSPHSFPCFFDILHYFE